MLKMQPIELLEFLNEQMSIKEMPALDNEDAYKEVTDMLNKATAYACYFRQMETIARIKKREAKQSHASMEEINRCLGIEEVFETFKRISEAQLELIAKTFTAKRLVLEEFRQLGKTT